MRFHALQFILFPVSMLIALWLMFAVQPQWLGYSGALVILTLGLLPFVRSTNRSYERFFLSYLQAHGWRRKKTRVAFPLHAWSGAVGATFAQSLTQGIIEREGQTWVLGYCVVRQLHSPLEIPVISITATLQYPLNGWVRLRPASSELNSFTDDEKLESIDFNKKIDCRASSPKLPFAVFAPDLMDWYLQQPQKFSIIVEQHLVAVVFEGQPDAAGIDACLEKAQHVVRAVEKSGALKQKTEPLLPRIEDYHKAVQ